ncbi:MAG: DUF5615 family PIN-like protein [Pyrinomonadaceae bacterium]
MIIWIDAQMSPAMASWISEQFAVSALALRELNLRDATDQEIFFTARRESVVVMTKDSDFLNLLDEFGAPPQVIWLTCGNTSNAHLKRILMNSLPATLKLLQEGERLIEISS